MRRHGQLALTYSTVELLITENSRCDEKVEREKNTEKWLSQPAVGEVTVGMQLCSSQFISITH